MEAARVATADDLARVVALGAALRAELGAHRGGALWGAREALAEPLDTTFRALLERDDARLVVGTVEDVVVGYGVAVVEELRDGALLGAVPELYVEPPARAVGVGEVVLDHLVTWCVGRGCIGVDAVALPGDRSAKNFYERAGFTARVLTMHRGIG